MYRSVALAAVTVMCWGARVFSGGDFACLRIGLETMASQEYIDEVRAMGPAGLEPMLADYDSDALLAHIEPGGFAGGGRRDLDPHADECLARYAALIDQVAGQRGATLSRLYWYTDLEQAKAAAAASGKPILSLRMLGKLTDEFSCANSRFFRTALYTNQEISALLRDNFVLHWQSVRPVPRVTIDFGDGRKLERTLTGNSAHYVLDAIGPAAGRAAGAVWAAGVFEVAGSRPGTGRAVGRGRGRDRAREFAGRLPCGPVAGARRVAGAREGGAGIGAACCGGRTGR